MHDGRFGTLNSVLDFYNTGVQETENIDPILKQSEETYGITLNHQEKEQIIAFLKTLTDEKFIHDERFAE
jgi:cytochrome c peroxidase